MERALIKLLLKEDFFNSVSSVVSKDMFPPDLGDLFQVIAAAHNTYHTDLSIDEVKALYETEHVLTRPARLAFNNLLDCIRDEAEPNPAIAKTIIADMQKKNKAREIGQLAARIINGDNDADLEHIRTVLEAVQATDHLDAYQVVSPEIKDLLAQSAPENLFAFRHPLLQEKILGAGPGHFGIIFGRPESGKSSLMAFLDVGYMEQGRNVLYFGNEEPGYKIMLNHVRSAVSRTDSELRADTIAGSVSYPEWDKIKGNLKLVEAVGMTIEEAGNIVKAEKPHVVVFDQLDKMGIRGEYSASHDRLKALYIAAREIAKRNMALAWGVSQASADGEGRRVLTFDMLDGSKTGKAGEADLVIGVGNDAPIDENFIRHLTLSKNKITGWKGTLVSTFDPSRCIFGA